MASAKDLDQRVRIHLTVEESKYPTLGKWSRAFAQTKPDADRDEWYRMANKLVESEEDVALFYKEAVIAQNLEWIGTAVDYYTVTDRGRLTDLLKKLLRMLQTYRYKMNVLHNNPVGIVNYLLRSVTLDLYGMLIDEAEVMNIFYLLPTSKNHDKVSVIKMLTGNYIQTEDHMRGQWKFLRKDLSREFPLTNIISLTNRMTMIVKKFDETLSSTYSAEKDGVKENDDKTRQLLESFSQFVGKAGTTTKSVAAGGTVGGSAVGPTGGLTASAVWGRTKARLEDERTGLKQVMKYLNSRITMHMDAGSNVSNFTAISSHLLRSETLIYAYYYDDRRIEIYERTKSDYETNAVIKIGCALGIEPETLPYGQGTHHDNITGRLYTISKDGEVYHITNPKYPHVENGSMICKDQIKLAQRHRSKIKYSFNTVDSTNDIWTNSGYAVLSKAFIECWTLETVETDMVNLENCISWFCSNYDDPTHGKKHALDVFIIHQ